MLRACECADHCGDASCRSTRDGRGCSCLCLYCSCALRTALACLVVEKQHTERCAWLSCLQRQAICIRDQSRFGVCIDDVEESYREKSTQKSLASQRDNYRVLKDVDVPLIQGCDITVGTNQSRIRLEWDEFVVAHSLLSKDQITAINESCRKVGVHVSRHWSDRVRVLMMEQIQMTPKMLLALIDQKDIVTPAYLSAIRNRPNISDPVPDPSHFHPDFAEGFPEDFKPFLQPNDRASTGANSAKSLRSSLLVNRTFVFLHVDSAGKGNMNQYKNVCEKAKAKVDFWEAARVVQEWVSFAPKIQAQSKKMTWHVLISDNTETTGVVASAVALLRKAGAIFSSIDTVWKAIVKADVTEIETDEFDTVMSTQSLDASAMHDTLSLAPGGTQQGDTQQGKTQGNTQQTSRTTGIEEKSKQFETVKGKRQREVADEESLSAPARGSGRIRRAQHNIGIQDDVVVVGPSPTKPTEGELNGRASKRTRGGAIAPASAPITNLAPDSFPTSSSALLVGAKGSDRGRAEDVDSFTMDAAEQQPEAAHTSAASPATKRLRGRQEKRLQAAGGSVLPQQPQHPDDAAPHAQDNLASGSRARIRSDAEEEEGRGQGEGSSSGTKPSGSSSALAVRAKSTFRKFKLEDEADPDGWVGIVSDGPAPRLPIVPAAGKQTRAGDVSSGGTTAGAPIVNHKRFRKKSDPGTIHVRDSGTSPQIAIVFDVWPRRSGAGVSGGSPVDRRGGKRRREAVRRGRGSDDSADE